MPALAPGALVQLGLVGFLYTYQHPALSREQTKEKLSDAASHFSSVILAVCLYGSTAQGQVGKNETVLNPNRAGTEQLSALAQLDSALVDGIVARRPFIGMEAFDAYLDSTLADSVQAELYVKLFLPINLNTASDAEMKLVPGSRQAHGARV